MKKKPYIILLLSLLMIACVSKKKFKALQSKYKDCRHELRETKKINRKLTEDTSRLTRKVELLQDTVNHLKERVDSLEEVLDNIESYEAEYRICQRKLKTLVETTKDLRAKMDTIAKLACDSCVVNNPFRDPHREQRDSE